MTTYPENLRYTKEHEWVRVDGDQAVIGITDHAQEELGDIVYVDLPKAGDSVGAGEDVWVGGVGKSGIGCLRAGVGRSRGSERIAGRST